MPPKASGHPPGQSRTAFQHLQEQLKFVDIIIEVLDARAPLSSRHPRSGQIFGGKPRILIITKEDLGDPALIKHWVKQFSEESKDGQALALSLKTEKNKDKIFNLVLALTKDKRQQLAGKGLLPRPMRICVVGMPNVGKSSLINWLIGQKKTKVGNKPGVTKGAQWVRVHPQIELLDTPGILPAFAFSQDVSNKLAFLDFFPVSLRQRRSCGARARTAEHPISGIAQNVYSQ